MTRVSRRRCSAATDRRSCSSPASVGNAIERMAGDRRRSRTCAHDQHALADGEFPGGRPRFVKAGVARPRLNSGLEVCGSQARQLDFLSEPALTLLSVRERFMMCSLATFLAFLIVFIALAVPASRSTWSRRSPGRYPLVAHDIAGLFQDKFSSVGDDLFIAGQPTEKALRELRSKGVTTIVNLRMPQEMERVGFDEAGLAKELACATCTFRCEGRRRIRTARTTRRFAAAMTSADGKVLLHCTIAWRASHLWAAYLIRDRNVTGGHRGGADAQDQSDGRNADEQPAAARRIPRPHGARDGAPPIMVRSCAVLSAQCGRRGARS